MHDRCFVNKVIGDHRHPASSENHIRLGKNCFYQFFTSKVFLRSLGQGLNFISNRKWRQEVRLTRPLVSCACRRSFDLNLLSII